MSRRFRPPPRSSYVWLVVLVVVILLRYYGEPLGPPQRAPREPLPPGDYRLDRVVDGDTLIVAPHDRVRLIGVNAPETVKPDWPVEPWGPEASAFTKKFVSGGTVRLEFDDEPRDEYDRYLAYVWVGDRMLNEELVRAGLARFEPGFHYSSAMKRRFRRAQDDARRKHLGIWSGRDDAPAPAAAADERLPARRVECRAAARPYSMPAATVRICCSAAARPWVSYTLPRPRKTPSSGRQKTGIQAPLPTADRGPNA